MGKNKEQLQKNNLIINETLEHLNNLPTIPFAFGNATPEDVAAGKTFTSGKLTDEGVPIMQTGTLVAEDLTEEIEENALGIQNAIESIVGKTTGANATANDIVKGKSAYVGQNLIQGQLELEDLKYGWIKEATGLSKIAIDKFSFTADTGSNTYINHSLGEVPRLVLAFGNNMENETSSMKIVFAMMLKYVGSTASDSVQGIEIHYSNKSYKGTIIEDNGDIEETRVKFSSSTYKFAKNVEYTLVTMA